MPEHGLLLDPVVDLCEEHVFQIGSARGKTAVEMRFAIDVQEGSATHQFVRHDFVTLLIFRQRGFIDGALPDSALKLSDRLIRRALIEYPSCIDTGHSRT